ASPGSGLRTQPAPWGAGEDVETGSPTRVPPSSTGSHPSSWLARRGDEAGFGNDLTIAGSGSSIWTAGSGMGRRDELRRSEPRLTPSDRGGLEPETSAIPGSRPDGWIVAPREGTPITNQATTPPGLVSGSRPDGTGAVGPGGLPDLEPAH